ncbi:sulfatase [Carboxylicivirga marina]|uniref:Sulfatase n=1 Tax=Carboxylicivirga marina TaxID=2800988 RepID=A0ABS1HNW0_9BACT|nr:sulfatase [Carboxylicivirga marina]MBK3519384.1 sulfatase [Carboxylicivirga marina]
MRKTAFILFITLAASVYAQNAKNVLFISVDDLRPELGCYGNTQINTPNIDALAGQSMLFTNAATQQAICTPSRISMLTGLRPATTGLYNLEDKLKTNHSHIISLPHALKNAGYKTYSYGKIYHHSDDDPNAWTETPWRNVGSHYVLDHNGDTPPTESADVADSAYPDGKIADAVLAKLDAIKDQTFFLAIGFMKPHLPYTCPKQYWDQYDRNAIPLASTDQPNDIWDQSLAQWQELRNQYTGIPEIPTDLDESLTRELKHGYWACVSYVDVQIGKILQKLDDLGLRENTIVVFWSDHGYKLGEYGDWCKHTNFEVDVRIPFMFDVPGKPSGTSRRPVESVDIYPTLMELLEINNYPDNLDGLSLSSLLDNPDADWKQASFTQYPRYGGHMGTSIRTEDFRYTEYRASDGTLKAAGELYDHTVYDANNPLGVEYNNVVLDASYATELASLKEIMEAGWTGVKYGASLDVISLSDNSVSLRINNISDATTLKLFERIDDGESIEILPGHITTETQEVTINSISSGKVYYYRLKVMWDENNYAITPEISVAFENRISLIDNGFFDAPLSGTWSPRENNGGDMTYAITDNILTSTVNSLGNNFYNLGFLNSKISSFSNKNIVVTFDAKANTTAQLRLTLDFDNKQYPIIDISNSWETHTLTYNDVSSSYFQFKLWLLTAGASYEIDNIEVYYDDSTQSIDPATGEGSVLNSVSTSILNTQVKNLFDFYTFKIGNSHKLISSEPFSLLEVYSIDGCKVITSEYNSATSAQFEHGDLSKGVYIIVLDKIASKKIIL